MQKGKYPFNLFKMKGIVLISIVMIFLIASVSALDKISTPTDTKIGKVSYPSIKLVDCGLLGVGCWLGGDGTVKADLSLKENTEVCSSNCYAVKNITLYESSALVDEVRFYLADKATSTSITSYKLYVQDGVTKSDVMTYTCSNSVKIELNGTNGVTETCSYIKTGTKESPVWKAYTAGEVKPAGSYMVKLEGKKPTWKTVDWQIKTQGTWIDDWATWGPAQEIGLKAYYKLDETSGSTALDNYANIFDGTYTPGVKIGYAPIAKFGTAYNFSLNGSLGVPGANNTLNFSTSLANFTKNFTIVFWYYRTVDEWNSRDIFWGMGGTTDGNNVFGAYVSSNKDDFRIQSDGCNGAWANANIFNATKFIPKDKWVMFTAQGKLGTIPAGTDGEIKIYINDTNMYTSGAGWCWNTTNTFNGIGYPEYNIGLNPGAYNGITGIVDEVAFYDTYLSQAQITALYNAGVGMTYTPSPITVELLSPANNTNFSSVSRTFIANYTTSGMKQMVNATYNIWNSTNILINSTLVSVTATNTTSLSIPIPSVGSYYWNVYACGTLADLTSTCSIQNYNSTFNKVLIAENSQTYNASTYETSQESFGINVSASGLETVTSNFVYDGTRYAATKSGDDTEMTFAYTLSDVPTVSAVTRKQFYWEILYGTSYVNSTFYNQTVNPINFSFCDYSAFNHAYINFTFKDEETDTAVNGSIDTSTWNYYLGTGTQADSYLYSNLLTNITNYPFCFLPSDKTLNYNVELQYSFTGYPQRRYSTTSTLTNSTTQKVLYLLGSSDGLYSRYITQSSAGSAIQGVSVTVERQFAGVWTIVEQGTTDSSGTVTFWLNPDYDHRLTFTKTGYSSVQVTVRPSASDYTVIMSTGTGAAYYNSSLEGLRWIITPNNGELQANTAYTFAFNITASKSNLVNCKMEIWNNTGIVTSTATGCSASGGNLSLSYNTGSYTRLIGKYYLDIGDGYFAIETDAYWYLIPANISDYTIWSFLTKIRTIDDSFFGTGCGSWVNPDSGINYGEHACRAEYSRIVLIFFILFLVFGMISLSTGWDIGSGSPGGLLLLLFPVILLLSIAGFFNIDFAAAPEWIDKYAISLIAFFITGGYLFNNWAKT